MVRSLPLAHHSNPSCTHWCALTISLRPLAEQNEATRSGANATVFGPLALGWHPTTTSESVGSDQSTSLTIDLRERSTLMGRDSWRSCSSVCNDSPIPPCTASTTLSMSAPTGNISNTLFIAAQTAAPSRHLRMHSARKPYIAFTCTSRERCEGVRRVA